MLTFKKKDNTVTITEDEIIVSRLLAKVYVFKHSYDGTVGGLAKAVNTVCNMSNDDFKLFAQISNDLVADEEGLSEDD